MLTFSPQLTSHLRTYLFVNNSCVSYPHVVLIKVFINYGCLAGIYAYLRRKFIMSE